ncbi:hypothetical protein [[Eubacterium] cellulosolvens]
MKNRVKKGNLDKKEPRILIYFLAIIIFLMILQGLIMVVYGPYIQKVDKRQVKAEEVEDRIDTYGEIWNSYRGGWWIKDCHEGSRAVVGITAVIKFEEPMNRTSVEYATVVQLDNNTWKLSEQYKPFTMMWDENSTTLTLGFPIHYLKQANPERINYSVNGTAKTSDGAPLGSDYESGITLGTWVELEIGPSSKENNEISYPPWFWYLAFFFPFLSVIIFFVLIEVLARKNEKIEEVTELSKAGEVREGIAEVLLKLLHYTEKWLNKRLTYTLAISVIAILLYLQLFYFILPFAWYTTIGLVVAIILVIIPWLIFIIFSFFYYKMREDNIKWKRKIRALRKHEEEFISNIG